MCNIVLMLLNIIINSLCSESKIEVNKTSYYTFVGILCFNNFILEIGKLDVKTMYYIKFYI